MRSPWRRGSRAGPRPDARAWTSRRRRRRGAAPWPGPRPGAEASGSLGPRACDPLLRKEAGEVLEHLRQVRERDVLHDPLPGTRLDAAPPADPHVHRLHDFVVHAHLRALEPDIGELVVATAGGAARPVDAQR